MRVVGLGTAAQVDRRLRGGVERGVARQMIGVRMGLDDPDESPVPLREERAVGCDVATGVDDDALPSVPVTEKVGEATGVGSGDLAQEQVRRRVVFRIAGEAGVRDAGVFFEAAFERRGEGESPTLQEPRGAPGLSAEVVVGDQRTVVGKRSERRADRVEGSVEVAGQVDGSPLLGRTDVEEQGRSVGLDQPPQVDGRDERHRPGPGRADERMRKSVGSRRVHGRGLMHSRAYLVPRSGAILEGLGAAGGSVNCRTPRSSAAKC